MPELDLFPVKNRTTSILIQVQPEEALEAQLVLTKNLIARGFNVIILSGGRPCRDLISTYEAKKIDLTKIHVLDMVCRSQRIDTKDSEIVTHMENIQSLTKISVYLNKMDISNKTVLFIDSLTSMLIYSDEEIFSRFISDIVQKMKVREVHLVLLIVKTKNYDNLRSELKYLCNQEASFK